MTHWLDEKWKDSHQIRSLSNLNSNIVLQCEYHRKQNLHQRILQCTTNISTIETHQTCPCPSLKNKQLSINDYNRYANLLMQVNCQKIMHMGWDFDVSSAQTYKHQIGAQLLHYFVTILELKVKDAVINVIHMTKQTFYHYIHVCDK